MTGAMPRTESYRSASRQRQPPCARTGEINRLTNAWLTLTFSPLLFAVLVFPSMAQNLGCFPEGQQIPPLSYLILRGAWETGCLPCSGRKLQAWLDDIRHWHNKRRIRIGYDSVRYEMPALKWTQSSFIRPQMMVEDRCFYDLVAGEYTVDRYADDFD